jgi:hypothetical protein
MSGLTFDSEPRRRLLQLGVTPEQLARLEQALPIMAAMAASKPAMTDVRDELEAVSHPLRETLAALEQLLKPTGALPARVAASLCLQRTRVLETAIPTMKALQRAVGEALNDLEQTRELALVDAVELVWGALRDGWADEQPTLRDADQPIDLSAPDLPEYPFKPSGNAFKDVVEVVFQVFNAESEWAWRKWRDGRNARRAKVVAAWRARRGEQPT